MEQRITMEQTSNGFCYKSYENYEKGEGICYVSEYGIENPLYKRNGDGSYVIDGKDIPEVTGKGDAYTRESIEDAVRRRLKEYYGEDCARDWQVRALADYVFGEVDWRYIETYLDEIDLDDWTDCHKMRMCDLKYDDGGKITHDALRANLKRLRDDIVLGSLNMADYGNSLGVSPKAVSGFFDGYLEFLEGLEREKYGDRERLDTPMAETNRLLEEFDTPDSLESWYYCHEKFEDD